MIWPRRCAGCALVTLVLMAATVPRVAGRTLAADLSKDEVSITAGFSGTDVLVFGTVNRGHEVAVVVRGPATHVTMRRKSQIAGLWINTAAKTFSQVPSFYAVAASQPLGRLAAPGVLDRNGIGVDALDLLEVLALQPPAEVAKWRAALIRAKQRKGLYSEARGRVTFMGERLFRTRVHLPANVPTGIYAVETYAFQDGRVVRARTMPLRVAKAGIEAQVSWFAEHRSAVYGLAALLIALLSGWLSYLVFRRD